MPLFKKQKPKPTVIDLYRDKEVCYRVTIDPAFVQFESASKDWLVMYSAGTTEAAMANSLVRDNELDTLTLWVQIQYMMRIEVKFILMSEYRIKRFVETLSGKAKEVAKASQVNKPKQSDDEILAEQKVQHEQTAESINELETLKKKKKWKTN